MTLKRHYLGTRVLIYSYRIQLINKRLFSIQITMYN